MRERSSIYNAHQCAILAHDLSQKREPDFHHLQAREGPWQSSRAYGAISRASRSLRATLTPRECGPAICAPATPVSRCWCCLHGSGGHAEAYIRNLAAHAEHFWTWSIDMLGHGYTDKPDHPLEVGHYVEHLMAVLRTIGVRSRLPQRRIARRLGGRPHRRRPSRRRSSGWSSTRPAARRPIRW